LEHVLLALVDLLFGQSEEETYRGFVVASRIGCELRIVLEKGRQA
jgi:hypothetical protein